MAVEKSTEQFGKRYHCQDVLTLADLGEHFDVILLTEVIEHPTMFIQTLNGLLNPGGCILVTTPNKDVPLKMVAVGGGFTVCAFVVGYKKNPQVKWQNLQI